MQMVDVFPFIEKENFIHKGIISDGNIITGIGMFFREFAEVVLNKLGYDVGDNFLGDKSSDYTDDDLTFYWPEEDYLEFLDELKEFQA